MDAYISACTIHRVSSRRRAKCVESLTPMTGIKFFNGTLREEVIYERLVVPIDEPGTIRNPEFWRRDATYLLFDPLTNSARPFHACSPGT